MIAPEQGGDIQDDVEARVALDSAASGFNKELRRLLWMLAVAVAAFGLLYFTPAGAIVRDIHHLRAWLAGDDLWAEASYAAIVIALVALGVPRLTFYVLGGLAFGFWQGLLLAQIGAVTGSWLTFWAVRHGGRAWLARRLGDHRLFGRALHARSSVKAVVLIRQLPLTSIMINGGLALSEVSARVFLIGTFIGYLPQGIVAALIGSGVVDEKAMDGIGKLVAAGIALLLGVVLLWRWRGADGKPDQSQERQR
ncbi:MAG: VTT domain-containing protein [Zoogloeaceae bacterium]|jgi:uncharacterized membrane protein YdjX (TVP38/TMEM64 family)|nr:VTT domain-containing protein [Zoogloeaceae bacterium]